LRDLQASVKLAVLELGLCGLVVAFRFLYLLNRLLHQVCPLLLLKYIVLGPLHRLLVERHLRHRIANLPLVSEVILPDLQGVCEGAYLIHVLLYRGLSLEAVKLTHI
jgi:hypothetical protein